MGGSIAQLVSTLKMRYHWETSGIRELRPRGFQSRKSSKTLVSEKSVGAPDPENKILTKIFCKNKIFKTEDNVPAGKL